MGCRNVFEGEGEDHNSKLWKDQRESADRQQAYVERLAKERDSWGGQMIGTYSLVTPLNTEELTKLKEENNHLSACLCAILTELSYEGIFNEVIQNAESKGDVKIREFWDEHCRQDRSKLEKILSQLSEHEKHALKMILNKNS